MSIIRPLTPFGFALALTLAAGIAQANPFADSVPIGGYTPGLNVTPGYDDPTRALGMPTLTNGDPFGDVTPFNGAFLSDHLVQVGDGGELIVYFDTPVVDDPLNPFGIDLLVFGNSFFFQPDLFGDSAEDVFADPAQIAVSQDGVNFVDVTTVFADSLFPTSGFLDTPGPFDLGGSVQSDFTKPVDPAIDWFGKTFAEIVALYDGSGGGTGVDLAETGLASIQYVRITSLGGVTAEIDAFADVAAAPEPALAVLLGLGALVLGLRRQTFRP